MSYQGLRVDCDVHHTWASPAEIINYLPQRWREFMSPLGTYRSLDPPVMHYPMPGGTHQRLDAFPGGGRPAGSDYDTLRGQLLDPYNMARVVLSFDIGQNNGLTNVELATEICKAGNRWQLDKWLSNPDQRIYGALLVPSQLPHVAAEEIRRHGKHPRVKEIVMALPALGKPFGDPIYDPIYNAAADMDLTIGLHTGGEQFLSGAAHIQAGGVPNTRFERHNQLAQATHHHLMSYIVHGTFEKFPTLRVIAKEVGLALYPHFIWEMDGVYELLKQETSFVKRWPREYFYKHVWVASQPIEHSPKPAQLIQLLECLNGFEDRIVFATDYPHHDTDDPHYVDRRIPQNWWRKVFLENPAAAYNWRVDELTAAGDRHREIIVGAA